MNLQIRTVHVPDLTTVVAALAFRLCDVDWHLADIDALPHRDGLKGGWVTGMELEADLECEAIQFKWGVFDAVPRGFRSPVAVEPWADGNAGLWDEGVGPQMAEALFEIVFWDSTSVMLFGITPEQAASVAATFGVENVFTRFA